MPFLAARGSRVLAAGWRTAVREGSARARNLVIEAPDFEAAKAAFHSSEYAEIKALRDGAATIDLILVEGV